MRTVNDVVNGGASLTSGGTWRAIGKRAPYSELFPSQFLPSRIFKTGMDDLKSRKNGRFLSIQPAKIRADENIRDVTHRLLSENGNSLAPQSE